MIDREVPFDPTKTQWCWTPAREACSAVFGPFASREDCMADALDQLGPGVAVNIGHPAGISPADYVPTDLDTMLDNMNETFDDTEGSGCDGDPAFDVSNTLAAQEALRLALEAWAREYVVANHPWWATLPEDATT